MEKQQVDLLLQEGKSVQISPQGYSMYPFLNPTKDQVVIVPATAESYRRGDVVLYRRKGTPKESILVLHRIWKKKPDGYYMVGDNQTEIEGPILREQIVGYMAEIVKNGQKISVENPFYLAKSRVWLRLRPMRPLLSHMIAQIKRIFRIFQ